MIEHIVAFSFTSSTTKEQKNEAIRRLISLKQEIPGILDIQAGHNFSEKNQGYELGLTVRLEGREALDEYGPHPKHEAVKAFLKNIGLTDMIVLDFEC